MEAQYKRPCFWFSNVKCVFISFSILVSVISEHMGAITRVLVIVLDSWFCEVITLSFPCGELLRNSTVYTVNLCFHRYFIAVVGGKFSVLVFYVIAISIDIRRPTAMPWFTILPVIAYQSWTTINHVNPNVSLYNRCHFIWGILLQNNFLQTLL